MNEIKFILGKKLGQSQIFSQNGQTIPITIMEAGPCLVTQVKSKEKDGYNAAQIGFGESKKIKKPQKGHLSKVQSSKSKVQNFGKYLREFRLENTNEEPLKLKIGDKIKVDIFKEGDKVSVSGISKGKGFQGVVKRHGFSTGPASHGSDHHREPGSIGSMFPQHVVKGRKLPGRMGGTKVTIKNLEVVKVDGNRNIICIKGAVPGPKNELLLIKG